MIGAKPENHKPLLPTALGIAILAVLYAAAGRLGMFLAIEPGYATLIWPPSGLAVGMLLAHGLRLWPGVFLGSFAATVSLPIGLASTGAPNAGELAIAAVIAAGATLQAALGYAWVSRSFGRPLALRDGRDVIKLFVVAGPVTCLVSPTVRAATMFAAHIVPVGDVLGYWLTSWAGDIAGVAVFLPLVLAAPWSSVRVKWRGCSLAPLSATSVLVLLTLFVATFSAWKLSNDYISDRNKSRFEALAQDSEKALLHRMDSYNLVLISSAGFINGSTRVSRDDWKQYVGSLDVNANYPGIRGIGYIQRVHESELPALIRVAQNEGVRDFAVHPRTERDEHFVIKYIEPLKHNVAAIGLDITFEKHRLEAAEISRDSGKSTITKHINLVIDETKSPGFSLYHPVYTAPLGKATVAQRRAALKGWVFAPFVARNFMHDLTNSQGTAFELTVYDGSKPSPDSVIYDSAATKNAHRHPKPDFSVIKHLTVMQQPWTLVWTSTAAFEASAASDEPMLIFVGGMLFTVLLGIFLFNIARRGDIVRNLVEEQTREIGTNERQMKLLVRNVPAAVAMFDREMRYIMTSGRWLKDYRLQDRDIIGKSHYDVLPELFGDEHWREKCRNALQGMPTTDEEFRYRRPDGHVEWIKAALHPWMNSENQVGGIVLFAEFITEQKMERLRSNLLREIALEAAAAPSVDAIFASALQKVCVHLNWSIGHVYVWDTRKGALVSSRIWYVLDEHHTHAEFRRVSEAFEFTPGIGLPGRSLQNKKPLFLTNIATDANFPRNKVVKNLELRSAVGIPIIVAGQVAAVMEFLSLGIVEETEGLASLYELIGIQLGRVIERRQFEKELEASEEKFRSAMENASIGMALVSLDGTWLNANKALSVLFGYSEEELLAVNSQSIIHPDDVAADVAQRQRILNGENQNFQTEIRYVAKSGKIIWTLLSVSLVRNADGSPRYFIKQIQDISERKAVERLKSEFIATVSHELRTPLTSIRGALGLLANGSAGELSPTARRLTQIANENSARLSRLVNDILDVEKLEAGAVQMHPRNVAANELLDRAITANQAYAERYQVDFHFLREKDDLQIWVDTDRFLQIMANLLSNAVKFSARGGIVDVSAEELDGYLRVSVRDYGAGIPPSFRQRIFKEFAQADSADNKKHEGTGLGLNIAKRLAEAMGGNIDFESEVNVGTVFHVTFPLATESQRKEGT